MSKMVTVTKSVEIDAVWAGQCPICGQALEMRDVYREDGEAWTEDKCYNCGKTWYIVFKYSHIETEEEE